MIVGRFRSQRPESLFVDQLHLDMPLSRSSAYSPPQFLNC